MNDLSSFLASAFATEKPSNEDHFLLGLVATGSAERGAWFVRFPQGVLEEATAHDRPDAIITADATSLVLLLSGQLVAHKAIEAGIVRVDGTPEALERLATILSAHGF